MRGTPRHSTWSVRLCVWICRHLRACDVFLLRARCAAGVVEFVFALAAFRFARLVEAYRCGCALLPARCFFAPRRALRASVVSRPCPAFPPSGLAPSGAPAARRTPALLLAGCIRPQAVPVRYLHLPPAYTPPLRQRTHPQRAARLCHYPKHVRQCLPSLRRRGAPVSLRVCVHSFRCIHALRFDGQASCVQVCACGCGAASAFALMFAGVLLHFAGAGRASFARIAWRFAWRIHWHYPCTTHILP